MLECKNIGKTYFDKNSQDEIKVLADVNLTVKKNEIIALRGPSGSGKTTLINLISGLDDPTSGDIMYEGKSVFNFNNAEVSKFRNKHIGIVFQFFNLINDLTALENVSLPLMIKGMTKQDAYLEGKKLLSSFNLNSKLNSPVYLLSGGEAQRVSIARAVISNPNIILADEPTGNLDIKNTNLILDLLIKRCRDNHTSLILVTHNESILDKFDKIYSISNGKLI